MMCPEPQTVGGAVLQWKSHALNPQVSSSSSDSIRLLHIIWIQVKKMNNLAECYSTMA